VAESRVGILSALFVLWSLELLEVLVTLQMMLPMMFAKDATDWQ
jgi:hypothetical protein